MTRIKWSYSEIENIRFGKGEGKKKIRCNKVYCLDRHEKMTLKNLKRASIVDRSGHQLDGTELLFLP